MGDLFKEEIKNYVDSCNDAKSITGKMVMNHLYEKFSSSNELIKEQKQQLLQYATEQIGQKCVTADKPSNLSDMEFKLLSLLNEENSAIAPINLARIIFKDKKATKKQVNPDLYRLENKKLAIVAKNENGTNPMWSITNKGRELFAKA